MYTRTYTFGILVVYSIPRACGCKSRVEEMCVVSPGPRSVMCLFDIYSKHDLCYMVCEYM